MARSPATTHHRFQINKPFMVRFLSLCPTIFQLIFIIPLKFAFQLSPINTDFPNFVIIDDIVHSATTCSEASNFFDLGSGLAPIFLANMDEYVNLLRFLHDANAQCLEKSTCPFFKRNATISINNLQKSESQLGFGLRFLKKGNGLPVVKS